MTASLWAPSSRPVLRAGFKQPPPQVVLDSPSCPTLPPSVPNFPDKYNGGQAEPGVLATPQHPALSQEAHLPSLLEVDQSALESGQPGPIRKRPLAHTTPRPLSGCTTQSTHQGAAWHAPRPRWDPVGTLAGRRAEPQGPPAQPSEDGWRDRGRGQEGPAWPPRARPWRAQLLSTHDRGLREGLCPAGPTPPAALSPTSQTASCVHLLLRWARCPQDTRAARGSRETGGGRCAELRAEDPPAPPRPALTHIQIVLHRRVQHHQVCEEGAQVGNGALDDTLWHWGRGTDEQGPSPSPEDPSAHVEQPGGL